MIVPTTQAKYTLPSSYEYLAIFSAEIVGTCFPIFSALFY